VAWLIAVQRLRAEADDLRGMLASAGTADNDSNLRVCSPERK
jgi:hypothetical protein